ncbi:FAS1-like dehydratase domain-containing protein [Candidatus Spongiihabitans sp.]|uniref:FAS1-like dehydratase domain-containing protein n=1 Tax=Candidatus Spongiihabitans sp. TaxID=3101308 RepID=UPI003C7A85CE
MNPHTELTLDEEILSRWIGRREQRTDRIAAKPANFLRATLHQYTSAPDTDAPGVERAARNYREGGFLPPGWHWLYFLEAPPMDQLGRDGHAALGGFLPPVALPKRMWAGARLQFHAPIVIGEELTKTSVIKSVALKSGRSGELCFVTVNHQFFSGSVLKLEEDHDIVYRGASSTSHQADNQANNQADTPHPTPLDADISVVIKPTTTLLFRYSALTFNGHRIHYDLDFCKHIEGYPGLVVHAPLTATLMLELARNYYFERIAQHDFRAFNVTAVSPLFHDRPFTLHLKERSEPGQACVLWAANPDGSLALSATLRLP